MPLVGRQEVAPRGIGILIDIGVDRCLTGQTVTFVNRQLVCFLIQDVACLVVGVIVSIPFRAVVLADQLSEVVVGITDEHIVSAVGNLGDIPF